MRSALACFISALLAVSICELLHWSVADRTEPVRETSDAELLRLRKDVASLRTELESLRDGLRSNPQTTSTGPLALPTNREPAPAPFVTATRSGDPAEGNSRELVALLWRCLHDDDRYGVVARVEKEHLSPFDPRVVGLVQECYARIDELRARIPVNLDVARRRRAVADSLDEELRSGRVKEEDRERVREQVDHLRDSEDPAARELETALNAVLDDLSQQLVEIAAH